MDSLHLAITVRNSADLAFSKDPICHLLLENGAARDDFLVLRLHPLVNSMIEEVLPLALSCRLPLASFGTFYRHRLLQCQWFPSRHRIGDFKFRKLSSKECGLESDASNAGTRESGTRCASRKIGDDIKLANLSFALGFGFRRGVWYRGVLRRRRDSAVILRGSSESAWELDGAGVASSLFTSSTFGIAIGWRASS